ncbi:hypothetical protein JCM11641_007606 [Rhodosporidiobolus odoratus]
MMDAHQLSHATPASSHPLASLLPVLSSTLPQSLVRSRLSSSPTLLPSHLAQLVTALSLCARVSLRASALFVEAILESLQATTVTGLGVTRRALIAAVGSARAMHYVKEGLDWSGRDDKGVKNEDTFLQVLDKWTNLGTYFIHHTFTLAELFAMSSFYLTLNTVQTGFTAAEESVRLLDSILGSNESSRALSSIITLVRAELTREDPRYEGSRPTGLLEDQTEEEEEKKKGAVANLTALTKALTAFACLQTATHRRTLKTLKLRVVYDCTVVVEGSSSSSSSAAGGCAGEGDVAPNDPGKYAGPAAPLRSQFLHPPSPAPNTTAPKNHQRAKSTGALAFTPSCPPTSASGRGRRSRETSASSAVGSGGGEILTDVRSELKARAAAKVGSPGRSRCSSVVFDLSASSPSASPRIPAVIDGDSLPFMEIDLNLDLDRELRSPGGTAMDLLDNSTEQEIVEELVELCGTPPGASKAKSVTSVKGVRAVEEEKGGEGYEGDGEGEEGGEGDGREGVLPREVELALQEIEERYRNLPSPTASSASSSTLDFHSSPQQSFPPLDALVQPISLSGSATLPAPGPSRPRLSRDYSYEISISETRTTTTTTTLRRTMPGGLGGILSSSGEGEEESQEDELLSHGQAGRESEEEEEEEEEEEWVEVATTLTPHPSRASTVGRRSRSGTTTEDESEEERNDEGGIGRRAIPTVDNGAKGKRRRSIAGLSRVETLERPEESRLRLQLVLSTMTKKFTRRKRTIRRLIPAASGSGTSTPRFNSPASSPPKCRWPGRGRSGTSSSSGSTTTGTAATSAPTVRATSPPPSSSPTKKSKGSVLRAAVSKAFRQRQNSEQTAHGEGFETAFEETPLPTPMEEVEDEGRTGLGSPSTAYQTARASPAPPSSATSPEPQVAPRPSLNTLPARSRTTPQASYPSTDPPAASPSLRRASSVQTLRSTRTTHTTCTHAPRSAAEAREHETGFGHFPQRHLVENLQRFARYSSAAYGQSFLRILGIGKHEFKFPHTQHHANNHAFAHHVGIHVEDILLSSFTDPQPAFATENISPIVNYVAVDHSISAVVLSCRGSLGLSDILVDLTCDYEPIPVQDGDPGAAYFVHSGMFCSATILQRGTVHDVIKEALERFPTYGLVICGHSLGGGVASLLSILWSSPVAAFERELSPAEKERDRHISHPPISTPFVTSFSSGLPAGRPVSCYTYGVPCVASPDLVDYCRGLVISTVHGYDIVPTLSLGVLRDFKSMAMGFYSEQGTCEEIVGRVIGLCQRRFMAKRSAKKAAATAATGTGNPSPPSFSFSPFSSSSSPTSPPSPDCSDDSLMSSALTDPSDESRLVPLSADEITAGRGTNKALEPTYQDPSLLGSDDLVVDDVELSNWLWSLRTTIKASSDNEKLYPPGTVYVVENYTVFIASESSATGMYSRREGRRVLLRAVDDVERRFSEPVFSRSMLSDHSPVHYEACCDLLANAVL